MALNFPSSPTVGDIYADATSGFYFQWDGTVWQSYTSGEVRQIRTIDDLSGSFNGSTQTFSLTSDTDAVYVARANQLRVTLGGIVQSPGVDYTVSGDDITFTTAPASGLTFSAVLLGSAIGTVEPNARTTAGGSTGSIGAGTTTDFDIGGGAKAYNLLKIDTTHAAWIRIYTDSTSRTNDSARLFTTDPTPGSGVIAEAYTTTSGASTFRLTPGVLGWNDDSVPSRTIYVKVTNNETTSQNITVTLTIVRMED